MLAKELNYAHAARSLNISRSELKRQIAVLEGILCIKIFRAIGSDVAIMDEGRILVDGFQAFLENRDIKKS